MDMTPNKPENKSLVKKETKDLNKRNKQKKEILVLNNTDSLSMIEDVVEEYEHKSLRNSSFIESALRANAIAHLRNNLKKEFVELVSQSLMGTRLGFKADKNNYSIEIIKNCLIETALYGVHWTGNEFNIIAGNSYITKEGYQGLFRRHPDVTDMKVDFGIPRHEQNGRAIVPSKCSWKYKEIEDSIKSDIPVNVFQKSDDAAIGKAERKILHRAWQRITGNSLPDGDIVDTVITQKYNNYSVRNAQNKEIEIPDNVNVTHGFKDEPTLLNNGDAEGKTDSKSSSEISEFEKKIEQLSVNFNSRKLTMLEIDQFSKAISIIAKQYPIDEDKIAKVFNCSNFSNINKDLKSQYLDAFLCWADFEYMPEQIDGHFITEKMKKDLSEFTGSK